MTENVVPIGAAPSSAPMGLDEQVFRRHLEGAKFQSGLDRGKWRLLAAVAWPYATIAVSAASRPLGPAEFAFRFDLTHYPQAAPTAGLWDVERDLALEVSRWPYGSQRFMLAFNPHWQNGRALYLPCDRVSLVGHDNWRTEHPEMVWTPEKDVSHYLNILHEYLNSRDYQGARQA